MDIPNDFYTTGTLFSLTGAATAVWIITSVIGYVMDVKDSTRIKKWLGLALSLILALLGATQVQDRTSMTWVVALVNGFLIYLTAVGANAVVSHSVNPDPVRKYAAPSEAVNVAGGRPRGDFIEPWW